MFFFDNFSVFFMGAETMSPKLRGAQVALLQNSAGHRLRGPKLCEAQVEGSKTPGGRFAFNICPACRARIKCKACNH